MARLKNVDKYTSGKIKEIEMHFFLQMEDFFDFRFVGINDVMHDADI